MRKFKRNTWLIIWVTVSILALRSQVIAGYVLQTVPTATPVQVSLPTPLPLIQADAQGATNIPVTRTPTPEGSALLEAITEANVRSQPDPESDRLGTIRAGDTYTVLGRYYHWYQFQYDQSPSGTGWVFDELVNITGNANRIPDLTLGTPTPNVDVQQANSTLVLLTQTPGGLLTATAGVGALPLPVQASGANTSSVNILAAGSQTPLPTFTPPPNLGVNSQPLINNGSPVPNPAIGDPEQDISIPSRIPPILPILVLGGAGILGLLISSLRK